MLHFQLNTIIVALISVISNITPSFSQTNTLSLFDYAPLEERGVGFISLSDIYMVDGQAIPDIIKLGIENAEYIPLPSPYRERFLSGCQLTELDSVFIYNYENDILKGFQIKQLKVVAMLDFYTTEGDWPYNQENYMVGFEINNKDLTEFNEELSQVIIAVGKRNPFERGSITPIIWSRIESSDQGYLSKIPDNKTIFLDLEIPPHRIGEHYKYDTDTYFYSLKNLINTENEVFARHLVILNKQTMKVVSERIFDETEGITLSKLNVTDEANDFWDSQWTGKLFKHKAPVVFGFQYFSFGCPTMIVLDPAEDDLYINCDNRH